MGMIILLLLIWVHEEFCIRIIIRFEVVGDQELNFIWNLNLNLNLIRNLIWNLNLNLIRNLIWNLNLNLIRNLIWNLNLN